MRFFLRNGILMCGICGELRFDGRTADEAAIAAMSARLARRGPDHAGLYCDGPLGFGHRRLAVIDLSPHAHQPMVDQELELALVFNGTIYNYRELRRELEAAGHRFFSSGDTEVILKAYAQWGKDCVARLSGMFAFAIWDQRDGSLFLARDRLGIKPLYFTRDEKRLRFASTLPALLSAGGVDTRLDPVALHFHCSLHAVVPAPRTILEGVRKIAPASWMRIRRDGRTEEGRYWELSAQRPEKSLSEADWIAATRETFLRVVERHRLAADVPVGVLLSGGLDSSLIVSALADHVSELATFSLGYDTLPDHRERADEFEYSDLVARTLGTRHYRYRVPYGEVLARLPEAVHEMSEPMVSQDVVSFYLLGQYVSREVKVVLSGQGADEVFGGYFWYPQMAAASGPPVERFARHYLDRDHGEIMEMLTPAFHTEDVTRAWLESELARPFADTFMDQVFRLDVTTLVVDDPVKRVDNMTMAWGLEARVPFLDHELVELAARMPPELKLAQGGKYPLKAMARGLLPDEVIDRPKGYFPLPALKYVAGPFLELMRDVLDSPACRARGLYERAYVEKLLADPQAHFTRIQGAKLWHLALLEWWLQMHVDGLA